MYRRSDRACNRYGDCPRGSRRPRAATSAIGAASGSVPETGSYEPSRDTEQKQVAKGHWLQTRWIYNPPVLAGCHRSCSGRALIDRLTIPADSDVTLDRAKWTGMARRIIRNARMLMRPHVSTSRHTYFIIAGELARMRAPSLFTVSFVRRV